MEVDDEWTDTRTRIGVIGGGDGYGGGDRSAGTPIHPSGGQEA